jgi:glycosyltransferase involved in cell wall biosynthesis
LESHATHIKHPDLQRVIKLSHSRYFKGLVTISEILRQNFIRAGVPKEKILVLQDGVDVASFRNLPSQPKIREMLNLPSDRKLVIYCGSLFPDKGIEHILLVAQNLADVLFLLVGGREDHIRMWRNYANSHQISNVEFTGFVENSRVPLYLKAADALIMPYKTDQEVRQMDIHTTSPLKLFEYMAAKKPIISTNIPAISRTIKHGVDGLLAEPNDIGELAHLVEAALEDKKLAENLSHSAYEKVQKYDWQKRCETIMKVFMQ